MNPQNWQKSSYCSEGDSCIHVAATPRTIHLTESADLTGAILTTTPEAFSALLATLKKEPAPTSQGDNDDIPLRLRSADTVVTTTRHKWNAFVLGVQAGEFDHFVATH
ncbi:DUF397 domain-containing protein [Streptomyces sp. CoH27]|uniref:DUF397 domain-containing protein n=1 Tax=Streptomyces sp. CoH27 TaxID=2875763 RepID=UPI001CD541D9|nr:DUF397 domain-containing protein [Streptomyces sp. CoH27]